MSNDSINKNQQLNKRTNYSKYIKVKMDRSPPGSYIVGTPPQSSDKSNFRLKQLERQVGQYRETINYKNQQIQYLNQRNSQLLQGRSSSNKKSSDNIYQSSLQQQIQRLTLKLSEKNKQYERLHQKYLAIENDMVTLEDFATDLDRERKFLADKLANIQIHTEGDEVVGQLQNKLVLMSTEIMRLGQLNRNKTQQNSDLRFKLKERDQQKQLLQNELNEKQKTLMQFRQKVRALQKRLHEQQSNQQYENESTYKILSLQIERLNVQLNNKLQQIATLQYRNRALEEKHASLHNSNVNNRNFGQLDIQVQRLTKINITNRQEISQLETDIKKMRKQNKQLSQDNQRFRRNIRKLQEQLDETKKNYIKDQNEKIRIQVETSQRTIRQQRSIIDQLQRQTQSMNQQREQYIRSKFEEQVHNLKMQLQQSQTRCHSFKTDLMKYEQKLVMLSQQIERLSLQNNKFQQENAQLKRLQFKIQAKERQLREIQRNRQSVFIQLKRDKGEIQRYKNQIKDLWDKNRQLQSKIYRLNSLQDELQMTQQRLNSKQKQCKLLQQKAQQAVSLRTSGYRVQQLESQLQSEKKSFRLKYEQATYNYQRQKQNLKDTIYKLQSKIRQLSNSQSSAQTNYGILAEQIRRLNEVLSDSSQTIINQKRQIMLLQQNLQTAQHSLQRIKSMHVPNEKLQEQVRKRVQIYNKQIKLHQKQNYNLKSKLHEYGTGQSLLEQEIHNLRMSLQDARQMLRKKEQEVQNLIQDLRNGKRSQEGLITLIRQIKESNLRLERKLAQIQQDYIKRLQQKSYEKQQLQKEYIDYNRKIRDAESENSDLKLQVSTLRNKLQFISRHEQQLQYENQRIQNRLDDQLRDKANSIKSSNEEYRNKIYEYEQELKRNAKYIGQMESDLNNKNDQMYKIQQTIRQLQQKNYQLQIQNKDNEHERKRQMEINSQESRYSLDRKQQQLQNLRQQVNNLQQQIRSKTKIIEKNSELITSYENKLAMLSQQLERINAVIYNKNNQLQNLQQELSRNKSNASKQTKQTVQVLTIQITRLNTTLCESLQNIKELQQEIQNKNRQIKRNNQLTKKNEQILKDKIFQLEQQAERFLQENHKISANAGVLNRKIEDMLKMQKQSEEMRLKMVQINSQKNKYKNIITDLQSEILSLKTTYESNLQQQQHSLSSKATMKVSQIQEAKRQMERRVSMLVSENEELISQIHNLKRELEVSDQQFTNNKKQLIRVKNQNVNLTRQKEKYRLINQQVMSKIQKMNIGRTLDLGDKQAFEFRVKHLQSVIKQYQNQMNMMKNQMEKASRERSRQNSSVGSSNARLSSNNNSLSKGNSNQLQQKYNILQSLHLKLKREADGLRQKVTQYQFKMKKLKGQFELINKLTHQYKDENEYLRQANHSQCVYVGKTMQNQPVSMSSTTNQNKNEQLLVKQTLSSQIDRLGILNGNLRREIQDLRLQVVDSQSLRNRYQELMATFVLMAVELDSMRQLKG